MTNGVVAFICLCVFYMKIHVYERIQIEKSIILRYTISVCLCLGVGEGGKPSDRIRDYLGDSRYGLY